MADTFLATIEGPLGKADLYEVQKVRPDGATVTEYEVRTGDQVQTFRALGEAYIVAGELTGVKT